MAGDVGVEPLLGLRGDLRTVQIGDRLPGRDSLDPSLTRSGRKRQRCIDGPQLRLEDPDLGDVEAPFPGHHPDDVGGDQPLDRPSDANPAVGERKPRIDGEPFLPEFGNRQSDLCIVRLQRLVAEKGDLHGRHFDRLRDEPKHLIIKPTIDRKFKPGECSTISDYKDNIHWFEALTDNSFIFNIHVFGLKRPGPRLPTSRVYVDPEGEKLKGGLIRAPRSNFKELTRKYG